MSKLSDAGQTGLPGLPFNPVRLVIIAVIVIAGLWLLSHVYITVPAGHVAVGTFFGEVQEDPYLEGFHLVNPLYAWTFFDARQKTHLENATVPSQDQLTTAVDISVQYRINSAMAATIWRETGTAAEVLTVHLVPNLRSLLRELGTSIKRAEDFFQDTIKQQLQVQLTNRLRDLLGPKGLIVDEVLLRDFRLPAFITRAIEAKKEREQEVEKQKAELERFRTEQQQKIAQAEAERRAAEQEAIQIQLLADAQAYEIEKINKAIADNPAYIQLQSLEALKAISADKATKIYFINGDSPMPLPLMHMGEGIGK